MHGFRCWTKELRRVLLLKMQGYNDSVPKFCVLFGGWWGCCLKKVHRNRRILDIYLECCIHRLWEKSLSEHQKKISVGARLLVKHLSCLLILQILFHFKKYAFFLFIFFFFLFFSFFAKIINIFILPKILKVL